MENACKDDLSNNLSNDDYTTKSLVNQDKLDSFADYVEEDPTEPMYHL